MTFFTLTPCLFLDNDTVRVRVRVRVFNDKPVRALRCRRMHTESRVVTVS